MVGRRLCNVYSEAHNKFVFCFTVSSGSVTVNADSSVQILAEEAHPLERFDAEVSWVKMFTHYVDMTLEYTAIVYHILKE